MSDQSKKPVWMNHGIVLNTVALIGSICAAFGVGITAHDKAIMVTMTTAVLNFIYHAISHKQMNDGKGIENILDSVKSLADSVSFGGGSDNKPSTSKPSGGSSKSGSKSSSSKGGSNGS